MCVTGIDVCSAIGNSYAELVMNLKQKKSGLKRAHKFSNLVTSPLGEVLLDIAESEFLTEGENRLTKLTLSVRGINNIARETKVFERYRPQEIGLFIGTSGSCVDDHDNELEHHLAQNGIQSARNFSTLHSCGTIAQGLKRIFPIRGYDLTFNTACSASGHAILEGVNAIKSGLVKACFVGGYNTLTSLPPLGFMSLKVTDEDFCCPFAKTRKGVNLAEGGAFLLLESSNNCSALGNYGKIVGVGTSSDAYHMTHPEPSGAGMIQSMKDALQDFSGNITDISYINAHGTGTIANDLSEALAISKVFGKGTLVSSTKGYHGHTLGAAGALEAVVTLAALNERVAWAGVSHQDLDFSEIIKHANGEILATNSYGLSNSFGFGGNNVSILFAGSGS